MLKDGYFSYFCCCKITLFEIYIYVQYTDSNEKSAYYKCGGIYSMCVIRGKCL